MPLKETEEEERWEGCCEVRYGGRITMFQKPCLGNASSWYSFHKRCLGKTGNKIIQDSMAGCALCRENQCLQGLFAVHPGQRSFRLFSRRSHLGRNYGHLVVYFPVSSSSRGCTALPTNPRLMLAFVEWEVRVWQSRDTLNKRNMGWEGI